LLTLALARLRRDEWPMSMLCGNSGAAAAARNLLPAALLITIGSGWLRLAGQNAGLYGTATGTALYAITNVLALWAVTLWSASRLEKTELAQQRDRDNLQRALAAQDVISMAPRESDAVERAIVDQARQLVDAAGVAFAVLRGGYVRYRTVSGSANMIEGMSVEATRSFVGAAMLENRHAILRNTDDTVEEPLRQRMGKLSLGVLPLRSGSVTAGAIVVFAQSGTTVSAEQLDLLRVIANASAAALVQAEQSETRQFLMEEQAVELELLQEQFTAFMANIPAAAFIKDDKGRYVYGNRSLHTFLGRESGDVLGAVDEAILPRKHAEHLRRKEREILAGDEAAGEVIRFDETDGGSSWLLLRFPIRLKGERRFLGGVAVDITEQKRAQEQVAQLNASLELRVAARTEQLERMNDDLEAFTYSVSHDLRAPLRAMSGYSRILEESSASLLDEDGRRSLSIIQAEARRMGVLIDDLLAFSRVGRQSLAPTRLDVGALAEEVFAETRRHHEDRVLELSRGDLPIALADRSMIRQVLVNLLSNAAKYSRKNEPARIEIGAAADGAFNTYWVRDHGVGFDMRFVDKLFGVFQRLHSAEEFEGTGVGLAIVERIVTRHGGRVRAESVAGEGACFYFTLPASKRTCDE
jgi:PAS domain S-box-containing protein